MRLCLLLGKTKKELLDNTTAPELMEWMAYNMVEPLPDPWMQTGQLCAVWGGGRASDYMPTVAQEDGGQAFKTMLEIAGGRRG